MSDAAVCSDCFQDHGLRLNAERIGLDDESTCPTCGSSAGKKLTKEEVERLAHSFFVWGTVQRCEYGAAPVVQFNEHQKTSIATAPWFEADVRRLEAALGVGFFYYGPRLWMVGEVEPLKALQDDSTRPAVIQRIVTEYPQRVLAKDQTFFRLRIKAAAPAEFSEYDSAPRSGLGRLDSVDLPVLYASQDLEVCVHECRVTAEDDAYVATLAATRDLKLLNLTEILREEVSEFESLDITVHMLFLAGVHSYEVTRDIARAAHAAGYDGLVYPSYFSLLRTGSMPFATSFGISHRQFPSFQDWERSKTIANFGLFGRPLAEGLVAVRCINRVVLTRVQYGMLFGPVGY